MHFFFVLEEFVVHGIIKIFPFIQLNFSEFFRLAVSEDFLELRAKLEHVYHGRFDFLDQSTGAGHTLLPEQGLWISGIDLTAHAAVLLELTLESLSFLCLLLQRAFILCNLCFLLLCHFIVSRGRGLDEVLLNDLLELVALCQMHPAQLDPRVEVAESEIRPMNQLIDMLFDVGVHAELVEGLSERFVHIQNDLFNTCSGQIVALKLGFFASHSSRTSLLHALLITLLRATRASLSMRILRDQAGYFDNFIIK